MLHIRLTAEGGADLVKFGPSISEVPLPVPRRVRGQAQGLLDPST